MTGSIHFREGSRGDREAILKLRQLGFPHDDQEKGHPDFWEWEFMEGYAGAGRLFVAEANDRIVGHFAFVPQHYVAEQPLRGALAVDVMTHPDFRRQKVFSRLAQFSADQLREDFQVVTAYQIREPVMGGMLAGGWRPSQQIPVLLKPLSLRRIVQDFGLPVGVPEKRQARAPVFHSDSIRAIRPGDFEQIDVLLSTSATRQKRSAEFLRWRYLQNPRWRYELEGFFEGEKLRAFLIYREAILRRRQSLAIADAGASPGSDESLRLLIEHVCRQHGNLGLAAALMTRNHPAYRILRRSGFIPGPHRFRLLLQVFDESLRWISDEPWSLSWGDTDHL